MLKTLTIDNFRGIKHLTIKDVARVNLVVGGNNSGKTSVLEALVLATNLHNLQSCFFITRLIRTINSRIDDEHLLDGLWRSFFYQLLIENTIAINVQFSDNTNRLVNIKPLRQKNEEIQDALKIHDINQSFNTIKGLDYTVSTNIEHSPLKASLSSFITSDKKVQLQIEGNEIYQNYPPAHTALMIAPTRGLQLGYEQLQIIFNNPALEKRIRDALRIFIPALQNLYINGDQVYLDTGFGRMNINFFGDGVRNIFAFIALIVSSPNTIIAIDEIDTGLHYSFQKEMWKAVLLAAKENNVQLFATTHSDECIAALSEAYQEVWKGKEEDEIRLFRIEKEGDGTSHAATYAPDILAMALERHREVR